MSEKQLNRSDFPAFFGGIFAKAIIFYKNSFLNYLLLATITFLPFLLFDAVSTVDTLDLIEFFHGNFLDIIIFLTLPTVFMRGSVFPFATIQLFFQRFFASAVLISFIQLGTWILFTVFFAQISLGAMLISIIPYIFLIFAGFFLIMENSSRIVSIRSNLASSMILVRSRFFVIFWNYINVTIITLVPLFIFTVWFLGTLPETNEFAKVFSQDPENSALLNEKLINLIEVFNQSSFKWSRISIHILFRPIKSLFLSFLFLGIVYQLNPEAVRNFLGIGNSDISTESSEQDIADSDDEGFKDIR